MYPRSVADAATRLSRLPVVIAPPVRCRVVHAGSAEKKLTKSMAHVVISLQNALTPPSRAPPFSVCQAAITFRLIWTLYVCVCVCASAVPVRTASVSAAMSGSMSLGSGGAGRVGEAGAAAGWRGARLEAWAGSSPLSLRGCYNESLVRRAAQLPDAARWHPPRVRHRFVMVDECARCMAAGCVGAPSDA